MVEAGPPRFSANPVILGSAPDQFAPRVDAAVVKLPPLLIGSSVFLGVLELDYYSSHVHCQYF